MIADELIKTNKAISRLKYEFEEYDTEETREVLDAITIPYVSGDFILK